MSVCCHINLFLSVYMSLSVLLSFYPSVHLSFLSICPSVRHSFACLYIFQFIGPFFLQSICSFVCPSVCWTVHFSYNSFRLSLCLSICQSVSVSLYGYLSVLLSVYPFVHLLFLSVCPSVRLSVTCLSILFYPRPSVCLSICSSIDMFLSVCMFICLSYCPFVYLPFLAICPSVLVSFCVFCLSVLLFICLSVRLSVC